MELVDELIDSHVMIWSGLGVSIIIIAIILLAVSLLKGGQNISPLSCLAAIIFLPLLTYQFSFMFGAFAAKDDIRSIEERINTCALLLDSDDAEDGLYEILSDVQSILPGLSAELGLMPLGEVDENNIGGSLMSYAQSHINRYILFRFIWSAVFVILAVMTMLFLTSAGSGGSRRSSSRHEVVQSRRYSSNRYSTERRTYRRTN